MAKIVQSLTRAGEEYDQKDFRFLFMTSGRACHYQEEHEKHIFKRIDHSADPKEIFKKSIVYSCNLGQKGQQETKKNNCQTH